MSQDQVRQTFAKITDWLAGEPNERIETFFKQDPEAYQALVTLMKITAASGWSDPEENILAYADNNGMKLADFIYSKAVGGR